MTTRTLRHAFATLLIVPLPALAAETAEIVEQIRAAQLDVGRAMVVRDLTIDMGPAVLEMDRGTLFPASRVAGHVREVVFVGEGRFVMNPPDEIERQQLELFTKRDVLEEPLDRAVLVIGDTAVATRLLDRPTVPGEPEVVEAARAFFEEWLDGAERRGFGADAAMLGAAVGDAAYSRYFAALCRSDELGSFYYQFDPASPEQISLGQFVPLELDDVEKHRTERYLRKQRRKGKMVRRRLIDLGDWNTWSSTSLRGDDGRTVEGTPGFESEHYGVELDISARDESVHGRARIRLRCEAHGRRVVGARLFSDLDVLEIVDGDGTKLSWFRSDEDLHVVLPRAFEAGSDLTLEIEYRGKVFDELEQGIFVLRDTFSWMPHVGEVDRATYDVTFRWPKRYELLASGRVVDAGVESGRRWEKRALELPSLGFSFEMGAFDVYTDRVGHVDLTVGFSKTTLYFEDVAVRQEVVETLKDALQYFENTFGPYPLDHLTVATVPRDLSQGYLGFVTLAHALVDIRMDRPVPIESLLHRSEDRRETIAHELSHQWWGNWVGWAGYRDQRWYSRTREFLECRLSVRAGDYKDAFSRLSKELRLHFPRSKNDDLGDVMRRKKFRSGRSGRGEDCALLAVTAHENGKEIIARRALEEAEERGADMAVLRQFLPPEAAR